MISMREFRADASVAFGTRIDGLTGLREGAGRRWQSGVDKAAVAFQGSYLLADVFAAYEISIGPRCD